MRERGTGKKNRIRGTMESGEKEKEQKSPPKRIQYELGSVRRGLLIKRNDEKFAAKRAAAKERNNGEGKRGGKWEEIEENVDYWSPLATIHQRMPAIGIRSNGLMILADVFGGPCVGRAGFVL